MTLPPVFLHGLLPGDGALGIALDVAVYGGILLAALGLVALSEDEARHGRTQLAWGAFILLVPLVGPGVYLVRRSRG